MAGFKPKLALLDQSDPVNPGLSPIFGAFMAVGIGATSIIHGIFIRQAGEIDSWNGGWQGGKTP